MLTAAAPVPVRDRALNGGPGRTLPGTGSANLRQAQQDRLRDAVRRALASDPRIRVVDLAPDGRRLAVSVAGEGMLMVELSAMASRRPSVATRVSLLSLKLNRTPLST